MKISPADTSVEMTQVVLPQFTNTHGTVFGGQILSWIDICAAVAAQRLCRRPVVTASIDAVSFLAPIKHGHIVILRSQVNAAFNTSMECGVSVLGEDPATGERFQAAKAYATFVAMGDDGKPCKVPALELVSKEEQRRSQEAGGRRMRRLEDKKAMLTKPQPTYDGPPYDVSVKKLRLAA